MLEFIMDKRIKITAFVKFIMIAAASILFMSAASFTFVSFFFAPPVYGAPFAARAVSSYFGFYEVEFYKGSNIVRSLKTSDIDGSGFNDITFLDIEKSRIAVLLNSNKSLSGAAGSDKNAPEAKRNVEDGAASALLRSSDASADLKGETGLNIIKYDERFVRFNIELERKIYDYQFIKLKGDTLESLVLISEPRWLILYRQDKNMQFYEYSKIQLEESNYSKARIAAGDIDSDGLDDIIVMCPDFFISAVNKEYNDFIQDVRYYSISAEYGSEPSQFKIFDINFDGLNDILYSYPSKTSNLRIKFASPGPLFLNDESYDLLNFHSMDFTKINVSGNASGENCIKNVMCCVLENSNRVYAYAVSAFRAGVKNGGAGLRSVYFHKNDRNSKNIRFFYDMNSDGITDACVVNPELGRLGVYYYNAADKVSEYKHFPFAARAAGAFCVRSASKDAVNIISFSRDGVLKSVMNGGGANYEFARLISCCDGAFLASRFLENQKEEKIALLFKDSTEVF